MENEGFDWSSPTYPKKGEDYPKKVRTLYVRDGETRRVMFLADEPIFAGYVHSLYAVSKSLRLNLPNGEWCVCPVRNDMEWRDQKCPLCGLRGSDGKNLSFATKTYFFPVLDLGKVVEDGDEVRVMGSEWNGKIYQFQVSLMRANHGSEKKPGLYSEIFRLRKKNGSNLRGLVCDTSRNGELDSSSGSRWEAVERVVLPVDLEGQKAVCKKYIQTKTHLFGEIGEDDNRMKYLSTAVPMLSDLPIYSPERLIKRYGLPVPAASSGDVVKQTGGDETPGDEEIPF